MNRWDESAPGWAATAPDAPHGYQVAPPNEPDTQPAATSWSFIDTATIVDELVSGTFSRPTADVCRVDGGTGLFYSGKVNSLFGESGSAKTWTILAAVRQELAAGQHVFMYDFEDDAAGVHDRLLRLGTKPETLKAQFHYARAEEALRGLAKQTVAADLQTWQPTLVLIDSLGELCSVSGVDPNKDAEVALLMRTTARAIADCGPCVIVTDHTVKSPDGGLWPSGSQRKRAAINGAAYRQDIVTGFSKIRAGVAKITCAKDRQGNYHYKQHVADLKADPTTDQLVRIVAARAQDGDDAGSTWRPTALMEKISRHLENIAPEGATKNELRSNVPGKTEPKLQAIAELISAGHVTVIDGPNRSQIHHSARPYRQASDPASDAYQEQNPTGEHLSPETVPSGPVGAPGPIERGPGEHPTPPVPGITGEHLGSTGAPATATSQSSRARTDAGSTGSTGSTGHAPRARTGARVIDCRECGATREAEHRGWCSRQHVNEPATASQRSASVTEVER